MPRQKNIWLGSGPLRASAIGLYGAIAVALPNTAMSQDGIPALVEVLGAASCSSTSCHGGAGNRRDQYTIWLKKDIHSRSYATLRSARSERMATQMDMEDPSTDARCTVCHAPVSGLPSTLLAKEVHPEESVTCASCHGPSRDWIRSHTRPDYSHQDRLDAGMRDLRDLHARANSCVACHQNLDRDIRQANHPELIFELDGQAVDQPKHWREQPFWRGPQAWVVGQAVALREVSWQLHREGESDASAIPRWRGLLWVVALATASKEGLPAVPDAETLTTDHVPEADLKNSTIAIVAP